MRVLSKREAPVKTSDEGEERRYYLDDRIELIRTAIPAGHEQPRHRHQHIVELTFVAKGAIVALSHGDEVALGEGDVVIFDPGDEFHTVANRGSELAETITIKVIPAADSSHEKFQRDKIVDPSRA